MKKKFIMTAVAAGMIAGSSLLRASTQGVFLPDPASEGFVVMRIVPTPPITMENLPKDLAKFESRHVKFITKRAEKGDDLCQDMLGTLYVRGIAGVQQNYELAADWLRRAYYDGQNDLAKKGLRLLIKKGHVKALGKDELDQLGLQAHP